jgi:hypothetical protein
LLTFKSYCQTKELIASSTGELQLIGDDKCIVPIELIRKANAKLIERKGFAQIICQQDTIIRLQKLQINEYNNIVVDIQSRITDANKYNEELHATIEKQRNKNKILVGTTCGAVAVTILVLLIK